jgi:hypothetical protein
MHLGPRGEGGACSKFKLSVQKSHLAPKKLKISLVGFVTAFQADDAGALHNVGGPEKSFSANGVPRGGLTR